MLEVENKNFWGREGNKNQRKVNYYIYVLALIYFAIPQKPSGDEDCRLKR